MVDKLIIATLRDYAERTAKASKTHKGDYLKGVADGAKDAYELATLIYTRSGKRKD